MSNLSSWQEKTDKLNKKNRLKLLYESLGKAVLEKGYLRGEKDDPVIEGILKDIEKLNK
jgi:hypothetical protein